MKVNVLGREVKNTNLAAFLSLLTFTINFAEKEVEDNGKRKSEMVQ